MDNPGYGKSIKTYMKQKGISQTSISKATGIPIVKLCLALNDKRRIMIDEYVLICEALGVDINYFVTPRLNITEQRS